jgi:hypothetical protein
MTDEERDQEVARRAALSPILAFDDFRPLASTVTVEIGARTERGPVRAHQSEHYLVLRLKRSQEMLATSLSAADLP